MAKLRGTGTDFISSMAACARVMAEETGGFILAAQAMTPTQRVQCLNALVQLHDTSGA